MSVTKPSSFAACFAQSKNLTTKVVKGEETKLS